MTSTKPGSGLLRRENAVDYVISLVGIVLGRGKRSSQRLRTWPG
jgi:hypothetical protein